MITSKLLLVPLAGFSLSYPASSALAQEAAASSPSWSSTIKVSGHVEAGITLNPADPDDHQNLGQLLTDRSNEPLLNQVMATIERPLAPQAGAWDVGFKLQGLVGSDARYTHFLGELDRASRGRIQFDIVEANVQAHAPILFSGGVDFKLGQYSTPLGYEVIDNTGNPFYSHSYLGQFGLPFKHTGGMLIAHASPKVDVYLGIDSGVNTTFGDGDNNRSVSYLGGIGLNGLAGGKLSIVALLHAGPEHPGNDRDARYIGDAYAVYKASDKLSFVTEFNYTSDAAVGDAWGVAQYVSYGVSSAAKLNFRLEVYVDERGNYVGSFPANLDIVDAQYGLPNSSFFPGAARGDTVTYGAVTLGVTVKPPALSFLTLRPEVRYDHSWGIAAFDRTNASALLGEATRHDQFTAGLDATLSF